MAIQRFQVYKCGVCGNVVAALEGGAGDLVCCGQPMALQKENVVDASKEKHVPVVEKTADGIVVKVGSIPHPMEAKHWIQWIEVIVGTRSCRVFLNPGDKPEATFPVKADKFAVREYCNLHGLWKTEI